MFFKNLYAPIRAAPTMIAIEEKLTASANVRA
jgi:hypothetical protein